MSAPVYLDHGATSFPKAPGVAAAVARFLDESAGNPGRGGHRLTVAASRAIEDAREQVAALLGGDPERTLFGSGATFWLNTLLHALLGDADRVVTSGLEHNALMRPLRNLQRRRGIEIEVVNGTAPSYAPSADQVAKAVTAKPTRLVALTHAGNVTGTILPVVEIARAVAPVPVVVDGAQTAGSIPIRFEGSDLAAFTCSGHKGLLGPAGTGVLLIAPGFDPEPLVLGGTGSRSDSEEMPAFLPDRLEAGTPNGAGIVGLGEACRWLAQEGVAAIHERTSGLCARLAGGLEEIPGVRLHGYDPEAPGTSILSFTLGGVDSGRLAERLDREHGLMLRVGLHCAPAAHRTLGTFPEGTLRAGLGPFNTRDDVDRLIAAVAGAR